MREKYQFIQDFTHYFLTFVINHYIPVFNQDEACNIFLDSLAYYSQHQNLCVDAYVIMPEHIHLIAFDYHLDTNRLRKTIHNLRKHTGRTLLDYCQDCLPKEVSSKFQCKECLDRKRQFWKSGIHPKAITGVEMWQQKIDYIHYNPVRRGLVPKSNEWKYSSAKYWDNMRVNRRHNFISPEYFYRK